MDIKERKSLKLKGELILKDQSDDEPWLRLTLGPSIWALEEFKRMNRDADKGDDYEADTRRHSQGLTLVDSGHDLPKLKLSLSRVSAIYCQFCAQEFYDRQVYGGHKGKCKRNQPSNGPQKFFCEHCAKDFHSLPAVSGHMAKCEKRRR